MPRFGLRAACCLFLFALLPACDDGAIGDDNQPTIYQADQNCMVQSWPNEVTRVNCLDTVEYSVVQRNLPYLANSFRTFASNRQKMAALFDQENTIARENWDKFRSRQKDLSSILSTLEPRIADPQAQLMVDLHATNMWRVCTSAQAVERITCSGALMRPVWQKDAPDSLPLFESFQRKRLHIAQEYDASGAYEINRQAVEHHNNAMQQMLVEYDGYCRHEVQTHGNSPADLAVLRGFLGSVQRASLTPANGTITAE